MNKIKDVKIFANRGGGRDYFCISWIDNMNMFGEIQVTQKGYDQIIINSEYMTKEFVKSVFDFLVDSAKLESR